MYSREYKSGYSLGQQEVWEYSVLTRAIIRKVKSSHLSLERTFFISLRI
jgi:hypothetical protein